MSSRVDLAWAVARPPAAAQVLRTLDGAGVCYCLLRGQPEADDGASDLDVLVHAHERERVRDMLLSLGFVERRRRPGPHKRVFARYRAGVLLCVDVHEAVVQSGLVYMDRDQVLARRVWRSGIPALSDEDLVMHLVWHTLLRRHAATPETRREIERLLARPLDRGYMREQESRFGLADLFDGAVRVVTGAVDDARYRRGLRRAFRRAVCQAYPTNYWYRFQWLAGRRRPRRRGGVIALVGPDGAGKSTVVAALKRRAAAGTLRIESAYLGPWGQLELPLVTGLRKAGVTPSLEPWGRWLASRLAWRRARAVPGAPAGLSTRGLLAKWLRSQAKGTAFYAALYAELLYRYARHVRPQVRRGRWVVSDRYVTDLRYLYKGQPMPNHPFLRALVCRLFPAPDLCILLDNEAGVIHARKPGLSREAIEACRTLYRKAIARMPHLVLKTDRTPDELADEILERVVRLEALR